MTTTGLALKRRTTERRTEMQPGITVTTAPTQAPPPTEPIQVVTGRTPWSQTFSALRVYNFRLFTIQNLVAMSGTWMQRIAQDWLVLQLSHSVTAVGITVAMQFTPMLAF